jgi:hypothetical protein
MVSFPPELRRYRLLVVASSFLLAGAGSFALVAASSAPPGTASRIPLVIFAITALPVAAFGLFFVPRWYHRAAYVVSTTSPLAATATLSLEAGSDSTSLCAAVSLPQSSSGRLERIALLIPRWNVRSVLGLSLPVRLHVDPSNSRLVAISTEHGMLWCMPTGQVVPASGAA